MADASGRAASLNGATTYDSAFFSPLFAIEDRHFWFRSRNQIIAALLGSLMPEGSARLRFLEVGCGTGNVLRVLQDRCPSCTVVGMDLFREGLLYAQSRVPYPLVQADMHNPPFRNSFDVIGLFDVLEHLPDDRQVLRDLLVMLNAEGTLFLTVPAFPELWSYFDEAAQHQRRYLQADLEEKLTSTGYRIEYMTYYMATIFPLVWLGRHLVNSIHRFSNRTRSQASRLAIRELRIIPIVNEVLAFAMAREIDLIGRRHKLAVGTSLLAIARKDK